MIRTDAVKLTVISAVAFRQKLQNKESVLTILRPDYKQPGMASISRKTGEAIPAANTNLKKYPLDAFAEAAELTRSLPYKKQKNVKLSRDMMVEELKDVPADKEDEVVIDSAEYQKIVDHYSDKNGKLSYDLMNKDFIRFAKSSKVVKDMVAEKKSAAAIRNYVVSNKFKNISGNHDLSGKQLKKITELLDEANPKHVYKEFNAEIRKMLSAGKKK